jgi:cell division septation protein DedD
MANSEDTEITLGTGKMLVLFFGLVAVCAVFFGLGFSLGRNGTSSTTLASTASPATANAAVRTSVNRPTTAAPSNSSSDQAAIYKPVDQKQTGATLTTKESADTGSSAVTENSTPSAPDPTAPPPLYAYYVQVAAVSKQGDAEALVSALKKKEYQAFSASNSPTDKLIHVQVGPFADIKDAEATRSKLISDGYNPILKK